MEEMMDIEALAAIVKERDEAQRLLAASMKSQSFLPITREEMLQQLAGHTQSRLSTPRNAAFLIAQPTYPPSSAALESLQSMKLTDLRVDVKHECKFVIARRTGQLALGYTTVTAGLEDEHGSLVFLAIDCYNFPGEDVLPIQSIVAIKEPYYTVAPGQGDAMSIESRILIEHPSDLVLLPPTNLLVPEPFRAVVLDPDKHALKCKENGNADLGDGDFVRALNYYTEGISVSEDVDLTRDITRNRALVQLKLGRLDGAIQDALASLSHETDSQARSLDGKAYHRAGCAAYQLGDFEQASAHFQAHLRLEANATESSSELARSLARVCEQSGSYNFNGIISDLSPSKPRVDAANFTQLVEVGPRAGCGRGLFSRQHIAFGQLIMCEKAICAVFANDPDAYRTLPVQKTRVQVDRVMTGAAPKVLMKKLFQNPSLIPAVLKLYAGEEVIATSEPDNRIVDGMPVLDPFQIHEIFHYNAFELGVIANPASVKFPFSTSDQGTTGNGLWCMASYANHSCIPNAHRCFIGDLMVLRATKDIAPGEEITISYITPVEYSETQYVLANLWGFTCTCLLCETESKVTESDHQKRDLYLKQLKVLQHNSQPERIKVQELIRKVNETYGSSRAPGLPRLAAEPMHALLMESHGLANDYISAADSAIDMLRCYGMQVDVVGGKVVLDRTFSMSAREIVEILVQISVYNRFSGNRKVAAEFERLAKEAYLMHNGVMHGYAVLEEMACYK